VDIRCIVCNKLLCKDIVGNMDISFSTDLYNGIDIGYEPGNIIEIMCPRCKGIYSIINNEGGDMKWLETLKERYSIPIGMTS